MSDLTSDQITDIRRNYLRDEFSVESANPGGISHYNRAYQKEFFTDSQIRALDDEVTRKFDVDLDDLEDEFKEERSDNGDDESTATAAAAAQRLSARYHLIAGLGKERMSNDPGYSSAQTVKGADVIMNRKMLQADALSHFHQAGISVETRR